MPGAVLPLFGALASSFILGAVQVDGAVFARAEVSYGIAPDTPGGDSQRTVATELTPGAGIRFQTQRSTLTLTLTPRFYQRYPNLADFDRPLVFVHAQAHHTYLMSRTLRFDTMLGAGYGEIDYLNVNLAFATPLSRRLDYPVLTMTGFDGRTGATWDASRRHHVGFSVFGAHSYATGDTTADEFPTSTTLGADAIDGWDLDAKSTLSFQVGARRYWVTPGVGAVSYPLGIGYRRALSLQTTLEALVGIAILKEEDEDFRRLEPRGGVTLDQMLYQRRTVRLSHRTSAAVDAAFDPTLGEVRPIAGLTSTLRSDLGSRWALALDASATTPVTESSSALTQNDTTISERVTATYRVSSAVAFYFGARTAAHASNLDEDEFVVSDREWWAFAGISAVLGIGGDGFAQ